MVAMAARANFRHVRSSSKTAGPFRNNIRSSASISGGGIGAVGDDPDYGSTLVQNSSGATALWTITDAKASISDEQKLAAMGKYAPLIWAAEGEEYFACSTDWSFQYLTRVTRDGQYWLYAKQDLSSPSDDLPLFKGNLSEAPVYAFWVEKAGGNYDICYFTYYGYNRGKEILDTIWGTTSATGAFDGSSDSQLKPIAVYMSQHDGGETISWADVEKSDTHPVAYAAWGSHALYSSGGDHTYATVLTDKCGKGTEWQTWSRVETYDYAAKKGLGSFVWPTWMTTDYTSTLPAMNPADPRSGGIYRWGNGKNGCDAGQCRLEDGPTGPIDKADCWDNIHIWLMTLYWAVRAGPPSVLKRSRRMSGKLLTGLGFASGRKESPFRDGMLRTLGYAGSHLPDTFAQVEGEISRSAEIDRDRGPLIQVDAPSVVLGALKTMISLDLRGDRGSGGQRLSALRASVSELISGPCATGNS